MIDWEIVRIVFYIALLVGAPATFFIFVSLTREDDLNTAQNRYYDDVKKEMGHENDSLKKDLEELRKVINEKEAIIQARDTELAKIRPGLSFSRTDFIPAYHAAPCDGLGKVELDFR